MEWSLQVILMKPLTLLCVDDDSAIRELYGLMFRTQGYEVVLASDPRQALDVLRSRRKTIDAVISDYEMPEMNGAQLASVVKRIRPELPFIMISGSPRDLGEMTCFVDATIQKGCPVRELIERVEVALSPHPSRLAEVSGYLSLGSVLAGAASAAFLLSRLLK